ncbi:SOS response-associated peptidase family protein [Novosphingobium terrae]|uniref:SOS response-associated peptidase family protein n=1 Tax=Novosphingobium terrae TaxID=2726189 RepID=UPI0019800E8F|nr:SOS response-associated peptidase family protein [Novosphingobium terrae]
MPRTYHLDAPADAIGRALGADAQGDVWQGGTVVPTGYAPVVIGGKEGARLVPRQWGVPPPPRGEHVVTHVRNIGSPFWIGTLRHTEFRCLVPATHFAGSGKTWLAVPSMPIFAFAGIWRDSEVPSFAILTTEGRMPVGSESSSATMPVILHPRDYRAWLHQDWKQAQRLVAPFPAQLLRNLGG